MHYIIDSKNRNQVGEANACNFVITLNPPMARVKKATLLWANIPNTLYNVQAGINDTIELIDPFGPSNIQIPAQFYSVPALVATLSSKFTAAGSQSYTVTYSPSTFKITIAASDEFALDFTSSNSCAALLGFANVVTPSSTSLTGSSVVNLGVNPLYIGIAELNNGVYGNAGAGYAFVIPINVDAGSTIQYESPPAFAQSITVPAPLYQLTIKLYSANNALANLNGADWQMLLRFDE